MVLKSAGALSGRSAGRGNQTGNAVEAASVACLQGKLNAVDGSPPVNGSPCP